MLSKWLWRFATERDSWWRKLIDIKYHNPSSVWQTEKVRRGFSQSVWANITKEHELFWKFASIDPGNGTMISFWHDVWNQGMVLSSAFPRVAAAVVDSEARLSDVASLNGELVSWSFNLKYNLRGGAERERVELLNFLNNIPMNNNALSPCRIVWNPDPNSKFSVSSLYRMLVQETLPGVIDFPSKQIWKKLIPSKVCFFMWLVYHNKLITVDSLKKRGWSMANRCCLCCKNEETINHLLVECEFVKEVWRIINRGRLVLSYQDREVKLIIKHSPHSKPGNVGDWFTYCILHAVWWFVWLERNQRVFEEKKSTAIGVARRAARNAMEWLVSHGHIDKTQGLTWLQESLLIG
ncbi:unnamed protein product [Linum tenue]|uniref:Reverse transcriptase zinc-binding domain-containing protein n=1 Tax=Linum tenue TaxID=586396 RepID=A0AAV0N1G7_9ROSI|nr:unnamed protein product [Linum tenue]